MEDKQYTVLLMIENEDEFLIAVRKGFDMEEGVSIRKSYYFVTAESGLDAVAQVLAVLATP